MILSAIWYHLCNLKNLKNTHGRVLLLLKPATVLKVPLFHGCFSHFLKITNGTKPRNTPHMQIRWTSLKRCIKNVGLEVPNSKPHCYIRFEWVVIIPRSVKWVPRTPKDSFSKVAWLRSRLGLLEIGEPKVFKGTIMFLQ